MSDLVRQAGFSLSNASKAWDAFWDSFKPVQRGLRDKGTRRVYGMGMQITTVGPNDGNGLFSYCLIANGGRDILTRDGRLHIDDPQVREAAIKSFTYMAPVRPGRLYPARGVDLERCRRRQRQPREAVRDGPRLHAVHRTGDDQEQETYWDEMVVMSLPNRNDGNSMPAPLGAGGGFIRKGAQNVAVAKDFMKYFMQPELMNEDLKGGLDR